MKVHNLSIPDLSNSLHTGESGLSSAEALRRLSEFGANAIEEEKRQSLVLKFLQGFTHFFALILWCGAALAFFAEWQAPGGGMGLLGVAILGVILINGVFSFWQEYKAEEAISALQKLLPHTVKVYRDGQVVQLPASTLVPGDLICIEEGDYVPADCRVVEAFALRVKNSILTGESVAVSRSAQNSTEEDALQCKNVLLAGTAISAGNGKAFVYATGMTTEFGRIAGLSRSTQDTQSPLQLEIARLSKVIACIAISVGVVFFIIGQAIGITFWTNILFALGIIIALVPEGLLPEVTLALATCSQRMAKRNALVRHLPSVETLGCASVICTDKTGTLTENKMKVKKVFLCGEFVELQNLVMRCDECAEALSKLAMVALHCENTRDSITDGKTGLIGDPMEVALVEFGRLNLPKALLQPKIDEIPFDTDRKRLTTVHKAEDGGKAIYTKGALELLLPLCTTMQMKAGTVRLTAELKTQILLAEKEAAQEGLRVLALSGRSMTEDGEDPESDLTFFGLVALEDPPREEVHEAIRRCHKAGIRVIMITGDHPSTAEAIAREVGMVQTESPVVILGHALRKMTDSQLKLMLGRQEVIFARTDADQKMRIVQALQQMGNIVAVTGDGVNDAPALKAADIGIAMGKCGTDVARGSADMILTDDNFASIVNAIEEGRAVFANIRKFLTYVLASNVAELIPCLAFVIFKIPLPLTVMQILSIDLGTDLLPALALGTEHPDPAIMEIPPRSRKEGLFDRALLGRAYLFLGLMIAMASMIGYFFTLKISGWSYGQTMQPADPAYQAATTACLMGIMCMQIVNSSMCRSERKSIFSMGLFTNRMLTVGVAVQILLMVAITYTPIGNAIFHTAALPFQFWLLMVPLMSAMFALEELRKWYIRKFRKNHSRKVGKIVPSKISRTKERELAALQSRL